VVDFIVHGELLPNKLWKTCHLTFPVLSEKFDFLRWDDLQYSFVKQYLLGRYCLFLVLQGEDFSDIRDVEAYEQVLDLT